ncbi:MAG: GNAT family N-acetyltransferase [Acidiferrobacterales bacterium]|nr:GNAT family N-acetyltransferase [Acidiferrobacterales bacterium]
MNNDSSPRQIQLAKNIETVDAEQWNRLAGDQNPFLRHEFLLALEQTGCVGDGTAWQPRHLLLIEKGTLVGAVPLYLKYDSYGEYVFDWAWANAYQQNGLSYYPKLVAAVPFTPVTGSRMLANPGEHQDTIRRQLIEAALALANSLNVSSLHWLFTPSSETGLLVQHQHLKRTGYQFHWANAGYSSFDDFLETFSSSKRKKVKRERRHVRDAGIEMEIVEGRAIDDNLWRKFYAFYRSTIECRGAIPYLNLDFFREIGRSMADNIVLVLARQEDRYVAGALNLKGRDTLFGRYWGSLEEYNSLHFETCYYRAIDYCIENDLQRFEAGAQGEHKLSRGFLPSSTYSAHWLRHPEFYRAISEFLEREQHGVEDYVDLLERHSPYKKAP